MGKNYFLKNIENLNLDLTSCKNILLVYHEKYIPPSISGIDYMSFLEFKTRYTSINYEFYIFVGVNRMINPANRCEIIYNFMQDLTRNIPKICIDNDIFIGEPWRIFWNYDIANNHKFNIFYSYAIETEWIHWFEKDINDCKISGKNIHNYLGETFIDLDVLNTRINFNNYEDFNWYEEAKDFIFSKYGSPKMIINGLLEMCNKRYSLDINYDLFKSNKEINLPDNKLYRFIGEEILRRKDIWNGVINHGKKLS